MLERFDVSPIVRISLGLVVLTVSILLIGDKFFHLGDRSSKAILDARKRPCESLAVQFSVLIAERDSQALSDTLTAVVRRNKDVLSAGLRRNSGELLIEAGVHDRFWKKMPFDKSTTTHAQVPIFSGDDQWVVIEVRFPSSIKAGCLPRYPIHS